MLPSFDLLCLIGWRRCFFTFFTSQNGMARYMWSHLHFLVLFGVKYPRIFLFSLLFVSWFGHDLRLVHSPVRKRWHCLPCDWFTSQDDNSGNQIQSQPGNRFPLDLHGLQKVFCSFVLLALLCSNLSGFSYLSNYLSIYWLCWYCFAKECVLMGFILTWRCFSFFVEWNGVLVTGYWLQITGLSG